MIWLYIALALAFLSGLAAGIAAVALISRALDRGAFPHRDTDIEGA